MLSRIGLIVAVIWSVESQAEIINVAGPFSDISSPTENYHIHLTVPKSVVGHCLENAGRGEVTTSEYIRPINIFGKFSDQYGDSLKGSTIYAKTYKCTYPYLTFKEITNSKFADLLFGVVQVGHDYYDRFVDQNPQYSNPDRDSLRFLSKTRGVYSFSPSTHTGRNAFLYTILTHCNPVYKQKKPATSIEELELSCQDSEIIAETRKYTEGPELVLFLGLDPDENK
jgi:hypothetical protein